jgi:hypothetical protein
MTKDEALFLIDNITDIIERLRLVHGHTIGKPLHTDIVCAQVALKHGLSMIKIKE